MKIKEIRDYPGYKITDDGHVYSPYSEIGWTNHAGYKMATLSRGDGSSKEYPVHRLVAEYFVPGHDEEHNTVDHINGDKLDNRAENLRWVTRSENSLYAHYEQNLIPNELKAIAIVVYDLETGENFEFRSINEAAKALGMPYWHLHDVVNGRRKSARGYTAYRK